MPPLQRNRITLDDVLARPDVWRGDQLASASTPALTSGFAALDAVLPGGGWSRGSLSEILCDQAGIGDLSFVMPALRLLHRQQRPTLLVAPPHAPCAPGWSTAGGDPAQVLIVAPHNVRDALWAAEQALASGALGAVLYWGKQISAAQVRRLEVAMAGSDTLGWLIRPRRAQNEASACALRLRLATGPRGELAVELLKRRGPPCPRTLYLDIARPLPQRKSDEPTLARRPFAVAASRGARDAVAA